MYEKLKIESMQLTTRQIPQNLFVHSNTDGHHHVEKERHDVQHETAEMHRHESLVAIRNYRPDSPRVNHCR